MRRSQEALSEALVAHLRNRKRRIVTHSIVAVLLLVALAIQCVKLSMMCAFLVPKEGHDLLMHVAMGQSMVVWMATVCAVTVVLALLFTYVVLRLIVELFGVTTRDDLLVQLWDRVQALEQSQTTPAHLQQSLRPSSEEQAGGWPEGS